MTKYSILSIDPGDTTGVAVWRETGFCERKWKMSLEDFIDWADKVDFPVSKIIVESYRQRPHQMNKKGSQMKASQGIGVVKALAKRLGAELIEQDPQVLKIAAMHAGVKIVNHFSDDVSAYLHGFYYLETLGVLRPRAPEF